MLRNVRFAFRAFRRRPRPYLIPILVLAAGIGISTAVFSLVEAVLLQPLPFPEQDQLSVIWKTDPKSGVGVVELAYPELGDLQTAVPAFSSVALMPTTLYGYGKLLQIPGRAPVQLESAPVSADFFRTLGVAPVLGRDFSQADEHVGAAPAVIISDGVWREQFHSDPNLIGQLVALNGTGYRIAGVMGPAVDFPRGAGLWVPLGVSPGMQNRENTYLQAIARRKPGYTAQEVSSQVNAAFARIGHQYPQFYPAAQLAVVTPLPRYWVGSARQELLIAFGASVLLFLTACITAGNLFLANGLSRTHEIATRSSLGAGSSQIAAQFLAEGLVAAAFAGVLGSLIASNLIRLLVFLAPPGIPRLAEAALNPRVILFGGAAALLTALACSAAPALILTRAPQESLLCGGGARLTRGRKGSRLQNAFTFGQTLVTLMLLTASVLIVISVRSMLAADIGFANRDAVTMNLALRGARYDAAQRQAFYTRLLERLRENPAVIGAAGVLLRPLEGAIGWDLHYRAAFNRNARPEELPLSNFEVVTPGYFATVGIPLLEGRDFAASDQAAAPAAAVISRHLAGRLRKQGQQPLGARIQLGAHQDAEWVTVIGVAGDTRDRGVTTPGDDIYIPYQQTGIPVNYLAIRGHGSARELAALVSREVAALDSTQTVAAVATIAELVTRDTARQRFSMFLLVTFGVGALFLAAAGVYSVVAEDISLRGREIAIRLALGADRATLIRHLILGTLRFVAAGELAGLIGCACLGPLVSGLLYAVNPADPLLLLAVTEFLFSVAFCAACIPAWRATRNALPVLS